MPLHLRRSTLLGIATAVVCAVATGCTNDPTGLIIAGNTLTIYSSSPLQGPYEGESVNIIDAEKLALDEAGGKVGQSNVNFALRDDSTAGGPRPVGWNPKVTAENAASAAKDSQAIAYLGDLDSGASAFSIPITNETVMAQISPAATATDLTKPVPGVDQGGPDKYYPSGRRSFVRIIPADDVQASAAALWARQMGTRRAFLLDDKSAEGQGLTEQFRLAASHLGLTIAGLKSIDSNAHDYRGLAAQIAKAKPDLVYFGGGLENTVRLWRELHAAIPRARLMGSGELLVPDFYRKLGGAGPRTYLTSPAQDPRELPARGRRFLRDYRRAFGVQAGPYAAYGYTAMSLLLDAIRRAGKDASNRGKVIDQLFATRDFGSAIGTFSIQRSGDTTLDRIAGYRIRAGRLAFAKPLRG